MCDQLCVWGKGVSSGLGRIQHFYGTTWGLLAPGATDNSRPICLIPILCMRGGVECNSKQHECKREVKFWRGCRALKVYKHLLYICQVFPRTPIAGPFKKGLKGEKKEVDKPGKHEILLFFYDFQ